MRQMGLPPTFHEAKLPEFIKFVRSRDAAHVESKWCLGLEGQGEWGFMRIADVGDEEIGRRMRK